MPGTELGCVGAKMDKINAGFGRGERPSPQCVLITALLSLSTVLTIWVISGSIAIN